MGRDTERDRRICELREQGKTYKEIGVLFGISAVRASQLHHRALWAEEHK